MASDPGSLANLHDIVVPEPVSLLPPAPGWYAIGALLVLTILWGLVMGIRRYRRNAYRRAAVAELQTLERRAGEPGGRAGALQSVPVLLKRAALAAYPRSRVAQLSGDAWFRFLDRTGGSDVFSSDVGEVVRIVAYRTDAVDQLDDVQVERMFSAAHRWLKHHRIESTVG